MNLETDVYTVFHTLYIFQDKCTSAIHDCITSNKTAFQLIREQNQTWVMTTNCLEHSSSFCPPATQFFNLLQSQSLRLTQLVLTIREMLEHQSCLCYHADKHQVYQSPKLMYMPNFVKYKLSHGSQDYHVQPFLFSHINEGGMNLSRCFSLCSILRRDTWACQ